MIRRRFGTGPSLEAVVQRLADWADVGHAVDAITSAANLEELAKVQSPN
jgi:hypothetical protein